ncbi:MAG: hypothetical protein RL256_333 [Actinomycetota bacterium]
MKLPQKILIFLLALALIGISSPAKAEIQSLDVRQNFLGITMIIQQLI